MILTTFYFTCIVILVLIVVLQLSQTSASSFPTSRGASRRRQQPRSGGGGIQGQKPAESLPVPSQRMRSGSFLALKRPSKPRGNAKANLYSQSSFPIQYFAYILTFECPVTASFDPSHTTIALSTSVRFMGSLDHQGYDKGLSAQGGILGRSDSINVEYVTVFNSPQKSFKLPHGAPWILHSRPVPYSRLSALPLPRRYDSPALSPAKRRDAAEALSKRRRGSKAGVFRKEGSGRPKASKNKRSK